MYCTKIGFYKGKSFLDWVVKIFTFSKISHCAIITQISSNYICGFSSFPFEGVEYFEEQYNEKDWEFFDIPLNRIDLFSFYSKTQDCGYDYCGCVNCIINFHQHKDRYFCSEWCAEVLGLENPESYSPVKLYKRIKDGKK